MTDITTTRSDLLTWAAQQPPEIKARAAIIARNLSGLKRAPDDEVLHAQTKENISQLDRLLKTALRD